jgi:hypothetical protein
MEEIEEKKIEDSKCRKGSNKGTNKAPKRPQKARPPRHPTPISLSLFPAFPRSPYLLFHLLFNLILSEAISCRKALSFLPPSGLNSFQITYTTN